MSLYSNKTQPRSNPESDKYESPPRSLDMILDLLDASKHHIWEPFKGSGHSTMYMRSKGFEVSNGNDPDFFKQSVPNPSENKELILVSNPPFSIKRQILLHLKKIEFNKIALLLPAPVLFTLYFREFAMEHKVQIVIHTKRCSFLNPCTLEPCRTSASFDCLWITTNLSLENDINFPS